MLAWFRRHAKVLMVVLGSAAMAIFGLGPVFDTLANRNLRSDERAQEVVATWKGGDITRVHLDNLEMRHYQAQRFLRGVQEAAEKKKGDVINSQAIPISPLQDGNREMVDDQLIYRFLMAERAKEEGMIVSNDMVNDYVDLLSGAAGFSQRDLDAINDTVNNRYCSVTSVREHLKTELLATQMQLCCMTAAPIIPNPIESMELYGRSMEQIECEVLPIEVDKYVGKVDGEPSPTEIKQLYEEGKYDFPDPTGQRPGFKVDRKVNLQYLIADYQFFLQNEMNKLSDEDVQKEYERLIEEKNEAVLEPLPVDDGSIQIEGPPPGDTEVNPPPTGAGDESTEGESDNAPGDVTAPPTTEGETVAPDTEGKSEEAKTEEAKTEEAKTEEAKTEEAKTEEAKTEEAKTEEAKTEEAKTEEAKTEEAKTEEGNGDQSFNVRASKTQFVSTGTQDAEPEEAKATEGQSADAKKPDPADASVPPVTTQEKESTDAKKPAADNVAQTPATEQSPNADSKPAQAGEASQEQVVPGGIDAIMKDAGEQPQQVERTPKPLKEVVEDVKRLMCEEATNKAMTEALTKASVMVQSHFEKRLNWEINKEVKEIAEPEPLDYEALGKKYNLDPRETGLVDRVQIADDQIGQVRVFMNMMIQNRPTPQLVPVGQLIFNKFGDLGLYASEIQIDNWGTKSGYLYWASKKADTRIPTLEEATPEIVKFWRKSKGLELAKAEAESIKEKVDSSGGKKLSELYSERVSQTGAFTWFSSFGSTRYSTPIGVKNAGEGFMETAFSLSDLKAGVAENQSRDTVYVIQTIAEAKSVEETGGDYLENQFFKFKRIPVEVQRVSQLYYQEFTSDFQQEFQDTMGLKYLDR